MAIHALSVLNMWWRWWSPRLVTLLATLPQPYPLLPSSANARDADGGAGAGAGGWCWS